MFRLSELVAFLKEKNFLAGEVAAFEDVEISRFASLAHPSRDALCWAKKLLPAGAVPDAAALLCLPEQERNAGLGTAMLHVREPRRAFGAVVARFYPEERKTGVSERAVVSPTARIGENVYIGPGCVIGDECVVGEGTTIDANVTLYSKVTVGKNCHISSGAVIGADGFGYVRDENNKYKRIRHMGNVVIGNNVDIGPNSCVARGVLDDTVIKDGTKIDNLAAISHNDVIGEDCLIIAGSVVCGSSTIGDNCWLSPGCVVENWKSVAPHNQIGTNSVVLRSIREENGVYFGVPARAIKEFKD